MLRPLAITALVLCCTHSGAQEPPRPSVEQLVEKVAEYDRQQVEITKNRAQAVADLKAELKRLQDLIDKLNLPDVGPKPVPPKPPEPADPLRAKLRAAYDADPADAAQKRTHARDLAALYRQAAKLAQDAAVATSGELLGRVRDAAGTLIGADALRECRRCVGAELGALLPTDDALAPDQRKAAADLFTRLAAILDTF